VACGRLQCYPHGSVLFYIFYKMYKKKMNPRFFACLSVYVYAHLEPKVLSVYVYGFQNILLGFALFFVNYGFLTNKTPLAHQAHCAYLFLLTARHSHFPTPLRATKLPSPH
jgi:hypothetical protein